MDMQSMEQLIEKKLEGLACSVEHLDWLRAIEVVMEGKNVELALG